MARRILPATKHLYPVTLVDRVARTNLVKAAQLIAGLVSFAVARFLAVDMPVTYMVLAGQQLPLNSCTTSSVAILYLVEH